MKTTSTCSSSTINTHYWLGLWTWSTNTVVFKEMPLITSLETHLLWNHKQKKKVLKDLQGLMYTPHILLNNIKLSKRHRDLEFCFKTFKEFSQRGVGRLPAVESLGYMQCSRRLSDYMFSMTVILYVVVPVRKTALLEPTWFPNTTVLPW